MFGKFKLALLYSFIGVLYCLGFEGRLTNQKSIEHDPERPNIDLKAMTGLSQYLRCDVVGRAAGSIPPLARMIESCTQPKIPKLNLHFIIKKNIAQLHISMNNALPVQILQPFNQLHQVILGLELCNPDPIPQKF